MTEAFLEWQNKIDIEDVVAFANAFSDEEIQDYYGCTYFDIMDHKKEIAARMRKLIDRDGMSMPEAREQATLESINSKTAVS